MKLFAIVADTKGAHEAECVYSIWTTAEGATAELTRLIREDIQCGCYSGSFHVTPIMADTPSNEWIE